VGTLNPAVFPTTTTNNFGNFGSGFSDNAKDGTPVPTFFEGSGAGRMMYTSGAQAVGRGFSFNVPADTTPRTLTFYCATNADAGAVSSN